MQDKTVISIACSTMKVDSFFKYAIAQLQSMKENSNIDIPIVFWFDDLSNKQLIQLEKIWNKIIFKRINHVKYRSYKKFSPGWFCLEGWTLTEYDKVIILDCDFICQGDLSELIKKKCDIGMVKEWTGIYNGGLCILGKKFLDSDWYKKIMELDPLQIKIGGNRDKWSKDQKIYNYFFRNDITEFSHEYNWLVSEKMAEKAKMIHYIYKPLYKIGKEQLQKINGNLITIWEKYYRRGCEQAGIQASI